MFIVITFLGCAVALKPKDAVFQVRVERELLDRFREICEARDMNVSQGLRRFMMDMVDRDDARRKAVKTE
jgi:hypothetical protein